MALNCACKQHPVTCSLWICVCVGPFFHCVWLIPLLPKKKPCTQVWVRWPHAGPPHLPQSEVFHNPLPWCTRAFLTYLLTGKCLNACLISSRFLRAYCRMSSGISSGCCCVNRSFLITGRPRSVWLFVQDRQSWRVTPTPKPVVLNLFNAVTFNTVPRGVVTPTIILFGCFFITVILLLLWIII